MKINFPTATQLRGDLTSLMQTTSKDTCWSVKLKDNDDLEPADVHGA
ncbi:hypothetical protein GCM10010149_70450 [Nonomuraea roseoviolacea subsp. roseoviolacea]|uniref:Uncharacterized protein n=1 Tax=Nonomuraea roseoviolacea subsp. carminata TaxID=160689 RepID=A0ABT1K987_9ACTN|nr:hypothetical protein [Nonomuraea roseoviolacea]MCP2350152.1 hypothetical protein [Nonomuraea roseoviolacea subsp. carminata]